THLTNRIILKVVVAIAERLKDSIRRIDGGFVEGEGSHWQIRLPGEVDIGGEKRQLVVFQVEKPRRSAIAIMNVAAGIQDYLRGQWRVAKIHDPPLHREDIFGGMDCDGAFPAQSKGGVGRSRVDDSSIFHVPQLVLPLRIDQPRDWR